MSASAQGSWPSETHSGPPTRGREYRPGRGSSNGDPQMGGIQRDSVSLDHQVDHWRMWKWWTVRLKLDRRWQARKARMRELESLPEPDYGYGPHWDAIIAGRREFTGKVLGGPYVGHDLLLTVYGDAALDRESVPADFSYSADYLMVDKENAGPGDDDPDPSFDTLEELREWLDGTPIEWHSPYVSLALIGRLLGYDGNQVP